MHCRGIIAGLWQLFQVSQRNESLMVPELYPAEGQLLSIHWVSPFPTVGTTQFLRLFLNSKPFLRVQEGEPLFWTLVFLCSEGWGRNSSVALGARVAFPYSHSPLGLGGAGGSIAGILSQGSGALVCVPGTIRHHL